MTFCERKLTALEPGTLNSDQFKNMKFIEGGGGHKIRHSCFLNLIIDGRVAGAGTGNWPLFYKKNCLTAAQNRKGLALVAYIYARSLDNTSL